VGRVCARGGSLSHEPPDTSATTDSVFVSSSLLEDAEMEHKYYVLPLGRRDGV